MISYQQQGDANCGPACVRTAMGLLGLKVPSERALVRTLGTKFATGTEPNAIADYLSRQGLCTEYKQEKNLLALLRRLDDGWMPIVCWADWGGHYVIVCEYADIAGWSGGYLKLADPAAVCEHWPDGFSKVSADRFISMWYTPGMGKKREVIYVKEAGGCK